MDFGVSPAIWSRDDCQNLDVGRYFRGGGNGSNGRLVHHAGEAEFLLSGQEPVLLAGNGGELPRNLGEIVAVLHMQAYKDAVSRAHRAQLIRDALREKRAC